MIGTELEKTHTGGGDFHDVVALQFSNGEAGLFGFLQITRAPASGKSAVIGLLFGDNRLLVEAVISEIDYEIESWDDVHVGPARMAIERPLERWSASLRDGDCGFDVTLEATTTTLDLVDPGEGGVGGDGGEREYAQMCNVTGAVTIDGREQKIACTGWRGHLWGAPNWKSIAARRSLYFGSPDAGSIAIVGSRPAGADGHDSEVCAGLMVQTGADRPLELDEIRWSTVYDGERRPDSAGLELFHSGEEYAHRMSGKAICKAALEAGGRKHSISFFRWSLDGRIGWGTYQTVVPT